MPTIDATYFFGELTIAQKTENANSLTMFINEHEEKLLESLLGYELYKSYKVGIAAGTPDAKWTALRDGLEYTNRSSRLGKWRGLIFTDGASGVGQAKKSLIANYVYWHWMAANATVTTANGEKGAKVNTIAVDLPPVTKQVRAWNQMVDWIWDLIEFLLTKESDYPEFQDHYSRIPRNLVKKQNWAGL